MSDGHSIPHDANNHAGDTIPVYGHHHTCCAIQSGNWANPTIWDAGRIPNEEDKVCIPEGFHVVMDGVHAPSTLEERVADLERRVTALETGQPSFGLSEEVSTCLDLVITGLLECKGDFKFHVRTITVLKPGHLLIDEKGEVVFRDMPIDTTYDPFQFGHGLIAVDGKVTIVGQEKTSWLQLNKEVFAGDQSLVLRDTPIGWLTGDELVLPETRQPLVPADLLDANRQTEVVTIASIEGTVVHLQSPVQFAHLGWRNQSGVAEIMPDVGNLSRSIVLRSENPEGTRGHLLLTGRSEISLKYVELRSLGRTSVALLNSTKKNADGTVTVGTNQIGRYALHFHHCLGILNSPNPYQFEALGVSIRLSEKWGLAIHGSHYGYVGRCVIDRAKGAGIVTETVAEYGSVVEHNMIIGRTGSGQRMTTDHAGRGKRNDPLGDFWNGGQDLGLTSAACIIRNNHIYNCQEGIGMAGFRTTTAAWPKFRGADPAVAGIRQPYTSPYRYPFIFDTSHNQLWSCWRGIETWTADCYPDQEKMFPNLTIIHAKNGTDLEDQTETTTYNWRILGDFTKVTTPTNGASNANIALRFKDGYEFGHTHFDCEYRGYDIGYRSVFPGSYSKFVRCKFECAHVVYQPLGGKASISGAWDGVWEGCTFLPVNNIAFKFIDGWYPKYDITLWLKSHDPKRKYLPKVTYNIAPWKDGRNLKIYHWFQTPNFALPPLADPTKAYGDLPPGVYSNAQLIALGTPIYGEVMPTDAVQSPDFGTSFWIKEV